MMALFKYRYTLEELRKMPTLATGQADDLKFDDGIHRVWLSRCTVADGEPYNNKVSIEYYSNGVWKNFDEYQAE